MASRASNDSTVARQAYDMAERIGRSNTVAETWRKSISQRDSPAPQGFSAASARASRSPACGSKRTHPPADEPTNNLDAPGRAAILALIDEWRGAALVASHDRDLLEHVDRIIELTPVGVAIFTGGWSEFAAARETRRLAAAGALDKAETDLRRVKDQAAPTRDESRTDAAEKQAASPRAREIAARLHATGRSLKAATVSPTASLRSNEALDKPRRVSSAHPPQLRIAKREPASRLVLQSRIPAEAGGRKLLFPLIQGHRPERIHAPPNGAVTSTRSADHRRTTPHHYRSAARRPLAMLASTPTLDPAQPARQQLSAIRTTTRPTQRSPASPRNKNAHQIVRHFGGDASAPPWTACGAKAPPRSCARRTHQHLDISQ